LCDNSEGSEKLIGERRALSVRAFTTKIPAFLSILSQSLILKSSKKRTRTNLDVGTIRKLLDFLMPASLPTQVPAQLLQDKGKARDAVLQIEQAQGTGWVLAVLESKDDRRPNFSYPLRRVVSEFKVPGNDVYTII
jgi:hypothetical protein